MVTAPQFLLSILDEPVAVFGGGVSGRAAAALVKKLGGEATVYDLDPARGDEIEFDPAGHKLTLLSPGFSPAHDWVVTARSAGLVCLAELDFAALSWRGEIVAVTGTNGKTTLTEFLSYALNQTGKDAFAVGNVGKAFSEVVLERDGGAPDSIAVCEVSSFQAESLHHFRADAALWTNFAEDHLERHGSMSAYFNAKWRLFERTIGGHVLAGSSVGRAAELYGQSLPEGAIIETEDPAGDVLLRGTVFDEQPHREDFLLAAAWWRLAGLREPILYAAAQSFELGPHRMFKVGLVNDVTWWDDSKATNFHATEAALTRFACPVILIAGGKSKGGDVEGFVLRIKDRVKQVLLIGESRNILATLLGAAAVPHKVCSDLTEAVSRAAESAQPGDDVLLSPAFSSLDQFSGYTQRGEQFVSLVQALPPSQST